MSRRRKNQRDASRLPLPVDDGPSRGSVLTPEIEQELQRRVQEALVYQSELFVGPLPHPEHLSEYERIAPGTAERIIRMAEDQAAHRRTLESKVVDSNVRLEARGQILAFAIAMTALIGGIGLMAFDKSVSGAATSITAIATLAGIFVWSKRQKRKDLKEKTHPTAIDTRSAPPPMPPRAPGRN